MSWNSKCCSGGGYTFSCLVIIGIYAVLVSVAFTIVTSLYMTVESCENIEAEVAKVVKITHVDALNQDNSYNGVKEPVDGDGVLGEHHHQVFCDCGTQAIWSFFEIIVLVAAVTGLLFMAVMIVGMCRGTFLKSRERRLRSEKEKIDKMEQDKVNEVLARVARGELVVPADQPGSMPRTGSKIELPA